MMEGYRVAELQLGGEMNLRDRIPGPKVRETADDLAEMGVAAVAFSGGGEPLIYPEIAQIVRRLGGGGIKIGSPTNGVAAPEALRQYRCFASQWLDVTDYGSLSTSALIAPRSTTQA